MSSFDRVIKFLDLRRASKDTAQNTKPLTIYRSRAIKKVQDTLTIPERLYDSTDVIGSPVEQCLLFQYNVTVGYEFSFDVVNDARARLGQLYIKWRNGNTVSRYRIPIDSYSSSPYENRLRLKQQSLIYAGERVPSNCVFEFWMIDFPSGMLSVGLEGDLAIRLSQLRNPTTADDVGVNIDIAAASGLFRTALAVTLPETLPYAQDNQAWLDNP